MALKRKNFLKTKKQFNVRKQRALRLQQLKKHHRLIRSRHGIMFMLQQEN
ncbi:hypothetical protein [Conservatibacter flavescens]|nr:hypothetical protein [Conservatibacter flavescens]